MTLPIFSFPTPVRTALSLLNEAGHPAYTVGGCVRDALLLQTPIDYDVTTSASPQEIERVFAGFRIIETGIKHGTVTVIIDGMPLEITTYRVESAYSDHRHPDEVHFTDRLEDDLARRDFTMNAIACDQNGMLKDPFGGAQDIRDRLVRCVGAPRERFREDALRILRALRFSSVLGFRIEQQTAEAIRSEQALLSFVSAERIFSELKKLLCGKNAGEILTEYGDVFAAVFPELAKMPGFEQNNPHHCFTVWDHTVQVVAHSPSDPVCRLAALLHDSGKPDTYSEDSEGIGHFYGHAARSETLARSFLERMKADNHTKDAVLAMICVHDTPIPPEKPAVRRSLNRLGSEQFFRLLALQRADNLGQHPDYRFRQKEFDLVEALARSLLEEQACFSLKDLAITGRDVIEAGIPASPRVGKALNKLLALVMDGKAENTRPALLRALQAETEDLT